MTKSLRLQAILMCCASGVFATDTQWEVLGDAHQLYESKLPREIRLKSEIDSLGRSYKVLTLDLFSVKVWSKGSYLTVSVADLIAARLGDRMAQERISTLISDDSFREERKRLGTVLRDVWHWANDLREVTLDQVDEGSEGLPEERRWIYRPIRSIDLKPKSTDFCLGMTPQQYDVLASEKGYGNSWVNEVDSLLGLWNTKQITSQLKDEAISGSADSFDFRKEDADILSQLPQYEKEYFRMERLRGIESMSESALEPTEPCETKRFFEFVDPNKPENGFTVHNYEDPFGRHWNLVVRPKKS